MYKFGFIHMTMCTSVTPLALELQETVNYPPKVDTWNWIQVLWKSNKQELLTNSKSSLNSLVIDIEVIHTHSLLGINVEAGKEEEIK